MNDNMKNIKKKENQLKVKILASGATTLATAGAAIYCSIPALSVCAFVAVSGLSNVKVSATEEALAEMLVKTVLAFALFPAAIQCGFKTIQYKNELKQVRHEKKLQANPYYNIFKNREKQK